MTRPRNAMSAREASTTEVDLDTLVLRVRSKDASAREALYLRFAPEILRIAAWHLGSSDEAHDILQDTFIQAIESIHTLREPSSLRAWLHCIALRQIAKRIRRRKILRFFGIGRAVRDSDERISPLPKDFVPEMHAELSLVERALDTLPIESRTAWIFRHVEAFSLDEIASATACSLATVKRRIASAESVVAIHVREVREENRSSQ